MMEGRSLGETILLVDDDADLINVYVDSMRFLGFEHIITANNGEDAITKYKTYRPDLVLMDINMPKMNGITVFRVIKNLDKDADIIFFTSDTYNHKLKDLEKDYEVEIISKNISLSVLEATIQKHLTRSTGKIYSKIPWLKE